MFPVLRPTVILLSEPNATEITIASQLTEGPQGSGLEESAEGEPDGQEDEPQRTVIVPARVAGDEEPGRGGASAEAG